LRDCEYRDTVYSYHRPLGFNNVQFGRLHIHVRCRETRCFQIPEKTMKVAGYSETIAPVNKSLRRHTPGFCDVYGYHPEVPRLLTIIKSYVPKIN